MTCRSCGNADAVGTPARIPWPIDDARHNVWLLACELAALEGHLVDGRRCAKCVTKHLATVAALAREGLTLDNAGDERALLQRVLQAVDASGWAPNTAPVAARELLRSARRAVCERQLQLAGMPNVLR